MDILPFPYESYNYNNNQRIINRIKKKIKIYGIRKINKDLIYYININNDK